MALCGQGALDERLVALATLLNAGGYNPAVPRAADGRLPALGIWKDEYEFDATARVWFRKEQERNFDYSDGDTVEEHLAAAVAAATDLTVLSSQLTEHVTNWPTRYHLSPLRANLLRPVAAILDGRILEVGAGCGAVTRFLGEKGGAVVALEGSGRRAAIAASRCRDLPNVEVVCDRFEAFPTGPAFDTVTLIGVLEWARRYGSGEDPVQTLLEKARASLRDDGHLVLAIENQLGLKYFAGHVEDHSGLPMFGIEDLYDDRSAVTFGRRELVERLLSAGFDGLELFVPLPDYKLPVTVITPSGLESRDWLETQASLLCASAVADPQALPLPLFSLERAWHVVARNGLLPDLANSFLLVARRAARAAPATDGGILAHHYGHGRRPQFLLETNIVRRDSGIEVVRRTLQGTVGPPAGDLPIRRRIVSEPFRPGRLWSETLSDRVNRPGWTIEEVAAWARVWMERVAEAAGLPRVGATTLIPGRFVDATPYNLVRAPDGSLEFIDLEWEADDPFEFGYLLFRSLVFSLARLRTLAEPDPSVPRSYRQLALAVAHRLGLWLTAIDMDRYGELEAELQFWVTGSRSAVTATSLREMTLQVRPALEGIGRIADEVSALTRQRQRLDEELNQARVEAARLAEEAEALARQRQQLDERLSQAELEISRLVQGHRDREEEIAAREREMEVRRERLQAELARVVDRLQAAQAEAEGLVATNRKQQEDIEWLEIEVARQADETRAAVGARTNAEYALAQAKEETAVRRTESEAIQRERQRLVTELCRIRTSLPWRLAATVRSARGGGVLRRPRLLLRSLVAWLRHGRSATARLIARSGLLDVDFYRGQYPDVAKAWLSPLIHYVSRGSLENRWPNPLFDGGWYLRRNPDVVARGVPPLAHYLTAGGAEGRDPSPLFLTAHYLRLCPEAAAIGPNPLAHYLTHWGVHRRSPHPAFDTDYYLRSNPDVAMAGVEPVGHFYWTGAADGRDPHPLFSVSHYLEQSPDVVASGTNPLVHYLEWGWREGRDPHPLFDTSYYLARYPDVAAAGVNPLVHYLQSGADEKRRPSPFFDPCYYLDRYADVAGSGINPLCHYLVVGWRENRRPNPEFEPGAYLEANPDVARAGTEPLAHYIHRGRAEGRSLRPPSPPPPLDTSPTRPLPTTLLPRAAIEAGPVIPTVLCLSHVAPYPPRAGNEYRIYRMLRWLRDREYRIVLVVAPLPGKPVDAVQVRALAREFGNVVCVRRDGSMDYALRDIPDILAPLAGRKVWPFNQVLGEDHRPPEGAGLLGIDRHFCHDPLIATVTQLEAGLRPCAVLAEYIWMSRVLPLLGKDSLHLIDTHDVVSAKRDKVIRFGVEDVDVSPEEEGARLARAGVVLAINEKERSELQLLVSDRPVVTVGVDFDVEEDYVPATGKRVVYVASDNPLNTRGLRDFLRYAWPLVLRDSPDAELVVAGPVGRVVPPGAPGVTVAGAVDDLRGLYRGARMAINPAVAGTGLKIKTLEALCHFRPLVTWPHGAEGLEAALAMLCFTVSDWYEFHLAVSHILADPNLGQFSTADRKAVSEAVAANRIYAPLDRLLREFFAGSGRGRARGQQGEVSVRAD